MVLYLSDAHRTLALTFIPTLTSFPTLTLTLTPTPTATPTPPLTLLSSSP